MNTIEKASLVWAVCAARNGHHHVRFEGDQLMSHVSTPCFKFPSLYERFFGREPFYPELVWPKPSPLTPHQTTYGTEPMTSKDNPVTSVTKDGGKPMVTLSAYRTLRDERDRLEEELAEATRALGEKDIELREALAEIKREKLRNEGLSNNIERLYGELGAADRHQAELGAELVTARQDERLSELEHLRTELCQARGDAVAANRRRSELGAELHTVREELAMQKELTAMAGREAQRLRDANTELHRKLANATANACYASYVVHDPGVYVVTQHGEDGIHVVKHLHRDAVVLTAHPDEEPAQWWQLYRDGITGNLTAWKPPKYLHDLIAHTAKHAQDLSASSWVGMDRGKPGDDMTTVSWRYPAGDPNVSWFDTVREAAKRIDRLEAWARQFPDTYVPAFDTRGNACLPDRHVHPLDRMEPKA